jgi:hypothetical protein
METSQKQSRLSKPNALSYAAIGLVLLSVLSTIGFVRGYLVLPNIFLGQFLSGEHLSPEVMLIFLWVIVPVAFSITAAGLLFAGKRRSGLYLGLTAVASHIVMDAIYIAQMWDGMHVVQAYTHAEWLVRSFSEHGGYITSIHVFYLAYVPALTAISLLLAYGRKQNS